MHIAVCGYYGMGNFGDDVYLRTLQKRLDGHAVYPWLPQMSPDDTDAVIIGGGDLITPYSFNPYYFPAALRHHSTWVYSVGIVGASGRILAGGSGQSVPGTDTAGPKGYIPRCPFARYRFPGRISSVSDDAPDIAFGYQAPASP
ncbi:hypothetical protein [Paenibacillus thiaminolyticus]|uniref:Polysaccharide pyruvyl transferase domain-containing protein n=1 Tax=Paenibacillus thiaminolyticus TaxID=49283 RepID=A0A3A3GGU6_PANTH|nr:hypothetical protein [Paenibacillus thiaminolyticus]RJG23163.1 hypothetical protein DQX05_14960 [Paenibacillus thiaminolyticus]